MRAAKRMVTDAILALAAGMAVSAQMGMGMRAGPPQIPVKIRLLQSAPSGSLR